MHEAHRTQTRAHKHIHTHTYIHIKGEKSCGRGGEQRARLWYSETRAASGCCKTHTHTHEKKKKRRKNKGCKDGHVNCNKPNSLKASRRSSSRVLRLMLSTFTLNSVDTSGRRDMIVVEQGSKERKEREKARRKWKLFACARGKRSKKARGRITSSIANCHQPPQKPETQSNPTLLSQQQATTGKANKGRGRGRGRGKGKGKAKAKAKERQTAFPLVLPWSQASSGKRKPKSCGR